MSGLEQFRSHRFVTWKSDYRDDPLVPMPEPVEPGVLPGYADEGMPCVGL
jgi:hypothetical protein